MYMDGWISTYIGWLPSAEDPKRISLLNNLPMVIRIPRINQSQRITTGGVLTKRYRNRYIDINIYISTSTTIKDEDGISSSIMLL